MSDENNQLVPLDWFTKPHEYSLFDYILENIDHIVDDMELKNTMIMIGAGITEGGNYKGRVFSTGYFGSEEDILCRAMNIIGKSDFKGKVIVKEGAKIIGQSNFYDYGIFGGNVDISGSSVIKRDIISSGKLKMDGRIDMTGTIYSDNLMILKGIISVESIRTTSLIYAQKELYISGEIIADEFIFSKGGGEVNSITAKVVSIGFRDKRTARLYHNKTVERKSLINPINLVKFMGGLVKHSLSKRSKDVPIFHVKGSIEADEIYLSNCIVVGDINAVTIVIGENVEVHGRIEYTNKLELTEKASGSYDSHYSGSDQLPSEG